MSKTPVINKNDGTSWYDTAAKLRTVEMGGGSTDWVQEDDTKAENLNVTENGDYPAASAGKYGYGYVNVSIPGTTVRGTKDGKTYEVTVDPNTGRLVYTEVED